MIAEATPKQRRDEYLSRVSALFERARRWTATIDEKAQFSEEDITIIEEPVGAYPAKVLAIARPGRKTVRLIPCGCLIIGAEGRVDLKSDLGTETLVYTTEEGPPLSIDALTENGKVLAEIPLREEEVAKGWFFLQNRQLGIMPSLDIRLFHRLLEVLGQ